MPVENRWTSYEDVVARWLPRATAPVGEDAEATIEIMIEDIETMILSRLPGIQQRIDDGSLDEKIVKKVTSDAIQRAWKVGGEVRNMALEVTGPWTVNSMWDKDLPRNLTLTSEEWSALQPKNIKGKVGWFNLFMAER